MIRLVFVAILAVTVLPACERRMPEQEMPVVSAGAPTLGEMRNATYHDIDGIPGAVTLAAGRWEGRPLVEGGAARPSLYYARDFRVTGDLDRDGNDEAVALLGMNAGGSGELAYIAVLQREGGSIDCVATALLGDRVKVREARIADGRIFVDVLEAGAADAMCCPGDLVTRVWVLMPGGLEEVRATPTGRLALSVLSGAEWVLKWWNWDEAASAEPEVTLRSEGRQLAGKAGCNQYTAAATEGGLPGSVALSAPTVTLRECPDPAAAVEQRFLAQLASVKRYSFVAGMLSLEYDATGSGGGVMLFERKAVPEPLSSE